MYTLKQKIHSVNNKLKVTTGKLNISAYYMLHELTMLCLTVLELKTSPEWKTLWSDIVLEDLSSGSVCEGGLCPSEPVSCSEKCPLLLSSWKTEMRLQRVPTLYSKWSKVLLIRVYVYGSPSSKKCEMFIQLTSGPDWETLMRVFKLKWQWVDLIPCRRIMHLLRWYQRRGQLYQTQRT